MLTRFKIPKTLLWVANLLVIFFIMFFLYRVLIYLFFLLPKGLGLVSALPAFALGILYDLRWISFVLLPIVFLSLVPRLSPFYSSGNKKWWTWYLALITFFIFFFFAAGFGSMSYNSTPLDAGAMNFVEDPGISLKMMFQTYPMVWMIAGLVAAVLLVRWMYHRSHWQVVSRTDGKGIPYRRKYFWLALVVLLALAWGRISLTPLGRNDSFRFRNSLKAYLAINPMQNFFATLKGRKPEFSEARTRQLYPVMAKWMSWPDPNRFDFRRVVAPRASSLESRPNIVLVQCESFSMYKSSMSGNPLNTTPYFDSLSRAGIFFDRCFTPHFATARALFAILSGIPDAQLFKFSSRNPEAVRQRTIINDFEDYDRHYFLGGSPEFGNFDGLLQNIRGLQMHTGQDFPEPPVNVWGISDKDLFLEANAIFRRSQRPFFAYIQTSGNHRPFNKTIPADDTLFRRLEADPDTLKKYGFESVDEYNCFRYFDYCVEQFMKAAAQESYFRNTVFVFVGDHGVSGDARALYPPVWTEHRLTDEHVPLLFYAPYLLEPQRRHEVVSQIDVLPTIAGLLHQPYTNSTLGRDLLDPAKKNDFAFITNTAGTIGMVTNDFYYFRNLNFPDEQLVPMHSGADSWPPARRDSMRRELALFTTAFFETARFLIMNNKE